MAKFCADCRHFVPIKQHCTAVPEEPSLITGAVEGESCKTMRLPGNLPCGTKRCGPDGLLWKKRKDGWW